MNKCSSNFYVDTVCELTQVIVIMLALNNLFENHTWHEIKKKKIYIPENTHFDSKSISHITIENDTSMQFLILSLILFL